MKQLRRIAYGFGGMLVFISLFIGLIIVVGMFMDLGAWLVTLAPTFFRTQREASVAAFVVLAILTVAFVIGYHWAKDREPSEP
jgi:TRAP-type C4-dicarboxylate transport system permease large subunit